MTDSLADSEKVRKPTMTKVETIKHLCFLEEERTRLCIEAIETKATDEIKFSTDKETARANFYFLINAKIYD